VPGKQPVEADQALRLRVRERPEEDAPDHREERGVRAERQRERQHDGRHERGGTAEQPQRLTQLSIEPLHGTRVR
jgi:hypothetical protein